MAVILFTVIFFYKELYKVFLLKKAMYKQTKLILICIFGTMGFFYSCAKTVYVPVNKTTKIIDTFVINQSDSNLLEALIECDSNQRATIKHYKSLLSDNSRQEATLKDNKLNIITKWKTKHIDRIITKTDTITIVKEVVKDKIIKKVPLFYKISAFIAMFFVGGLFVKLSKFLVSTIR